MTSQKFNPDNYCIREMTLYDIDQVVNILTDKASWFKDVPWLNMRSYFHELAAEGADIYVCEERTLVRSIVDNPSMIENLDEIIGVVAWIKYPAKKNIFKKVFDFLYRKRIGIERYDSHPFLTSGLIHRSNHYSGELIALCYVEPDERLQGVGSYLLQFAVKELERTNPKIRIECFAPDTFVSDKFFTHNGWRKSTVSVLRQLQNGYTQEIGIWENRLTSSE